MSLTHEGFWTSRLARVGGGLSLAAGLAAGGFGVASATESGAQPAHVTSPTSTSKAGSWHRGGPGGSAHHGPGSFGQVVSVGGSSKSGTCGSTGTTGTFTLKARNGSTVTVDVSSSTSYTEPGSPKASVAQVCVGRTVAVGGKVSSASVTATTVMILSSGRSGEPGGPGGKSGHGWPGGSPKAGAVGVVASVNGSTDSTACGVAGKAGRFTVKEPGGSTATVDVSTSTTFFAPADSSSSFADVCVGGMVGVAGSSSSSSSSSSTVQATVVGVLPAAKAGQEPAAIGQVSDVNGSSKSGTCGTAGSSGSFTLKTRSGEQMTVDVTGSTTFVAPGAKSASFAEVCVGDFAGAAGTRASGSSTIGARTVGVMPASSPNKQGSRPGPGGFGFPGGLGGSWGGGPRSGSPASGSGTSAASFQ